MCLYKQHRFPRFSFKPKTVYKVFFVPGVKKDGKDVLCTPYKNTEIEYFVGDEMICKSRSPIISGSKSKVLGSEVVHAYDDFMFAIESRLNLCELGGEYVICECIIPSFTAYWLGADREIGSTRLIISKIIE